jgi:hypothetical protein
LGGPVKPDHDGEKASAHPRRVGGAGLFRRVEFGLADRAVLVGVHAGEALRAAPLGLGRAVSLGLALGGDGGGRLQRDAGLDLGGRGRRSEQRQGRKCEKPNRFNRRSSSA